MKVASDVVDILRKVLALIPALAKAVAKVNAAVKAAKLSDSAGGSKVTPGEVVEIAAVAISEFGQTFLSIVTGAVSASEPVQVESR